jgi:hypothetical protein
MSTNATVDGLSHVGPRRTRRYTAAGRPDITLPDGTKLKPRARIAAELGVSERTIRRLNADLTYVGNVAYVTEQSVLQLIAETIKHRNQPPRTRRRRA